MKKSFPEERKNKIENLTFPIPFVSDEFIKDIIISTNDETIATKDTLINEALILHSQGNTNEAKRYYQKIIEIGVLDPRILNNYAAILNQEGNMDKAINLYEKSIHLFPNRPEAYSNLGNLLRKIDKPKKAEELQRKAININPNIPEFHYNLSKTLITINDLQEAHKSILKAIILEPKSSNYFHILGLILKRLGNLKEAEIYIKKSIDLNPNFIESYINLGSIMIDNLNFKEAEKYILKAIKLNPSLAISNYNLGAIYSNIGKINEARDSFLKVMEIDPNYSIAAWNLYGLANSFTEAEMWLNKCLEMDQNYIDAKISLSAIKLHQGEKKLFNDLLKTKNKDHILMRSIEWVTTLTKMPKLFFNKLDLYDYLINKSEKNRPFYEFGVCRGVSFKYLIDAFGTGYGFDTFEGLPKDWNNRYKKGSFSAGGIIPEIKGGTFIVGKFEDTLPDFFNKNRPLASIINFDADLYSSTYCAINYCKTIIDENTILIFDDFFNNTNWEEYEYKALNEFCSINNFRYEVIAISYFSRQVAIRLKLN